MRTQTSMRATVGVLTGIGAALILAPSAQAHHSFAMFDSGRTLTLKGNVKEFQWNNPHVFIQLVVLADAQPQEWSIELTSPSHLVRNGWKPTTLKVGDQITVVLHPLRDGRHGGQYLSAVGADGVPIAKSVAVAKASAP